MKKIIITIVFLGIIGAGWFLLSPLFINKTINEELPIISSYSADEAREITRLDSDDNESIADQATDLNQEVEITIIPPQEKPVLDTTYFHDIESKTVVNIDNQPEQITIESNTEDETMSEYEEMKDVVMDEPMVAMQSENSIETLGSFISKNNYSGSGQVKLIQNGDTKTLRFENFSVTNGPDLFVTLNKGNSPKGEHIILQKLKGNKGNQNYDISNIDLDDYASVSIYCRAFSREFATAQL